MTSSFRPFRLAHVVESRDSPNLDLVLSGPLEDAAGRKWVSDRLATAVVSGQEWLLGPSDLGGS